MFAFIKKHTLDNIKQKLLALYLLNASDAFFTFVLVNSGLFREINVFMIKAVDNLLTVFMLKIILPAVLIAALFYRMQNTTEQQLRKANILITSAVIFYALVNTMHLIWFILLLFVFH